MASSDWLKVFEEPEACAEGGTGPISVFQMRTLTTWRIVWVGLGVNSRLDFGSLELEELAL